MGKSIKLTFHIPENLHKRLKAVITHRGEQTYIINQAIKEFLDRRDRDANTSTRSR